MRGVVSGGEFQLAVSGTSVAVFLQLADVSLQPCFIGSVDNETHMSPF